MEKIMSYINKTVIRFLCLGALFLFPALIFGAYDVNLKGGVEIKEAAEIISKTMSLYSIKLIALVALGFVIALQGMRMLMNGISQAMQQEKFLHRQALLFGLIGMIFFGSGLVLIFKDEIIERLKTKKTENVVVGKEEIKEIKQ